MLDPRPGRGILFPAREKCESKPTDYLWCHFILSPKRGRSILSAAWDKCGFSPQNHALHTLCPFVHTYLPPKALIFHYSGLLLHAFLGSFFATLLLHSLSLSLPTSVIPLQLFPSPAGRSPVFPCFSAGFPSQRFSCRTTGTLAGVGSVP